MEDESNTFWSKLKVAIKKKGGRDQATDILNQKDGEWYIDELAGELAVRDFRRRRNFLVTIDYSQTLSKMADGAHFWNCDKNVWRLKINGKGKVEVEIILVQFHEGCVKITDVEMIERLDKMDLEPARIEHVCALAKKWLIGKLDHPIAFLGSSRINPFSEVNEFLWYSGSDGNQLKLSPSGEFWIDVPLYDAIRKGGLK